MAIRAGRSPSVDWPGYDEAGQEKTCQTTCPGALRAPFRFRLAVIRGLSEFGTQCELAGRILVKHCKNSALQ